MNLNSLSVHFLLMNSTFHLEEKIIWSSFPHHLTGFSSKWSRFRCHHITIRELSVDWFRLWDAAESSEKVNYRQTVTTKSLNHLLVFSGSAPTVRGGHRYATEGGPPPVYGGMRGVLGPGSYTAYSNYPQHLPYLPPTIGPRRWPQHVEKQDQSMC